jgi:acyl transferase domain-containing protein
LFAIEYALADLLHHWGFDPDYVIGHSVGEIVAACVAGVLDLEGAARFVVARGRLMGQLPRGGKMLAMDATAEEAVEWIRGKEADISLAAVNGPRSVVVSGRADAIDAVALLALAAGRRTKELEVSHAFHSPLMDPILEELSAVAETLAISPAKIPVASNVTGEFLKDDIPGQYWSSHVRRPVLFHQGVRSIIDAGCSLLIEVGPHPALTQAIAAGFDTTKTRCVTTLMRGQNDVSQLLETLASLHVTGVPLALQHLFWSSAYRRVPLPLYPFRRDRHWIQADVALYRPSDVPAASLVAQPALPEIKADLHPLLGQAVDVASRRVVFESTLAAARPWVDHRVLGSTVFPGTAYLEMASRGFAALEGKDWRSVVLRDVGFDRPLVLTYGKQKKVSLTLENLSAHGGGEATFVIAAAGNGTAEKYCRGRIAAASEKVEQVVLDTELKRRETQVPIGPFYGELRNGGLEYGAHFSTVRELWLGKPNSGEAIGRIAASPHDDGADHHPFTLTVLLDGCLHVFGAALETFAGNDYRGAFVPVSIQSITLRRELPPKVWSHVTVRTNANGRAAVARIRVFTDTGEVVADIDGLELRKTSTLGSAHEGGGGGNGKSAADAIFESREHLVKQLAELQHRQRVDLIAKWLAAEVKDVLGQAAEEMDLDTIDPSAAFLEIGLDSLLVTELQRRIQEKLNFRFQPMQGLDYQSAESLAEYILKDVLAMGPAQSEAQTAEPAMR